MSAVYKHTKRDMESLEKYMNGLQGDSMEKEQPSTDDKIQKRMMQMQDGSIPDNEQLRLNNEENTLES